MEYKKRLDYMPSTLEYEIGDIVHVKSSILNNIYRRYKCVHKESGRDYGWRFIDHYYYKENNKLNKKLLLI